MGHLDQILLVGELFQRAVLLLDLQEEDVVIWTSTALAELVLHEVQTGVVEGSVEVGILFVNLVTLFLVGYLTRRHPARFTKKPGTAPTERLPLRQRAFAFIQTRAASQFTRLIRLIRQFTNA